MARGIKTGAPEPDEAMLRRIEDTEGIVRLHPDKEEIKAHIRARLEEGHLSLRQLALKMGYRPVAMYNAFKEGGIISIPLLSRMLYIVDGNDCPYQYDPGRTRERIAPSDYLNEHPGISLNEWDQDDWIISDEDGEHRYAKRNHSLPDALAEYDRTRTK